MKNVLLSIAIVFGTMTSSHAYETAFPPTEAGVIEVKVLPAGKLIEASGGGDYFDESGSLFRPLFKYIKEHDIAMTVPVEAAIDPGAMRFWISTDEWDKLDGPSGGVEVLDVPERRVAVMGGQGSYSRKNFEEVRDQLMEYVQAEGLETSGEPYAVYWNGPFTLWWKKRFEVQVELVSSE